MYHLDGDLDRLQLYTQTKLEYHCSIQRYENCWSFFAIRDWKLVENHFYHNVSILQEIISQRLMGWDIYRNKVIENIAHGNLSMQLTYICAINCTWII